MGRIWRRLSTVASVVAVLVTAGLVTAVPAVAVPRGPDVTINQAAGQPDPTSTSPIKFTVVFSAAVTGFTGSDVKFATGPQFAPGPLAVVTGGPATYTVAVSGMTDAGQVAPTIPAGVATGPLNSTNAASTSTDGEVYYVLPPPSVTVNQATAQHDPTSDSPVAFTATVDEPSSLLASTSISFAGSTVGGTLAATVTADDASHQLYTIDVTGMTTPGVVEVSISADAVQNKEGGLNAASTSTDNTVTWQTGTTTTQPTVEVDQAAGQRDPTGDAPIVYSATFSAPVTGFVASDVSFAGSTAGGTLVAAVTGSGASYAIDVTGMTTSGTVIVSIPAGAATDASSQTSLASTSTDNSVEWVRSAPRPKRPNTHIKRVVNSANKTSVRFIATGAATRFQCALARGHAKLHFASCQSPAVYHRLRAGSYRFEVRAIGPGGTDKTPAKTRFSVTG